MADAKIEREKKPKATSRTSFKPRIVDSSALIEEKKKLRGEKKKPSSGLVAEGFAGCEALTDWMS